MFLFFILVPDQNGSTNEAQHISDCRLSPADQIPGRKHHNDHHLDSTKSPGDDAHNGNATAHIDSVYVSVVVLLIIVIFQQLCDGHANLINRINLNIRHDNFGVGTADFNAATTTAVHIKLLDDIADANVSVVPDDHQAGINRSRG